MYFPFYLRILIPAVGSALLVLLVVFCVWGYKRHKKTELKKEQALKDFYIGEGKSNIRVSNCSHLYDAVHVSIRICSTPGNFRFKGSYTELRSF